MTEMFAISVVEFGLNREEFLDLTPGEFFELCKAKRREERKEDLRTGLIVSTILNMFRGKKDVPFEPLDFFPQHQSEEYEDREQRQEKARSIMRKASLILAEVENKQRG